MTYRSDDGLVKPEWLRPRTAAEERNGTFPTQDSRAKEKSLRRCQRLEIDEWEIDVRSIMAEGGFRENPAGKKKYQFNKNNELGKLTAVMCRETRCVVAWAVQTTRPE